MERRRLYLLISRFASMTMIIGLFTYFAIRLPDIWLSSYNLMNLVEQTVSLGLVALGLTVVRATGEIDLAVGSTVSLSTLIPVGMIIAGRPIGLAIVATLLVGVCVGLANGFMRTTMRLPGVIPTLCSQSVIAGLAQIYTWGDMLFGTGPGLRSFVRLGRGRIGSLSIPATVFGVIVILVWFFLTRTKWGRVLYMIGGNPRAAESSGIDVNQYVRISFITCGVLSAASGLMMAARIGAGNPVGGADMLLDGIIAVMVGSTILAQEQEFSAVGSVVGAFFVTIVMSGLQMIGQGYDMQCLLRGILLYLSLGFFSLQRRASE